MPKQDLEVADIFRAQGQVWRQAHTGHISLGPLKVMSAIEACRSAALGDHVLRCSACAFASSERTNKADTLLQSVVMMDTGWVVRSA